jgi:hypothetical protein
MTTTQTRYVTAYEVTRHYGGPEEGGWWYNRYDPIETRPVHNQAEVEATIGLLHRLYDGRAHGSIYSVLGGVEVHVLVESEPREWATTERPRYE